MKKVIVFAVIASFFILGIIASGCLLQPEDEKDEDKITGDVVSDQEEKMAGDLTIDSATGSFIYIRTERWSAVSFIQGWIKYTFENTGNVPIHPVIDVYILNPDGSVHEHENTIDQEDYIDQSPNVKYIYKPKEKFMSQTLILEGFGPEYPEEDEAKQYKVKMVLTDKDSGETLDTEISDLDFED